MEPTEEQRRIVASQARGLVVEAGAGAAKTTTLGLYAGARQRTRILYLAFNKSIQLEAAARMPANVTCRTTHSIAWRKAVELFGKDAAQRVGKTYGSSVSRAFRCGPVAYAHDISLSVGPLFRRRPCAILARLFCMATAPSPCRDPHHVI